MRKCEIHMKQAVDVNRQDHSFFYNVVHKIQTVFTTNETKRNNYNKTWDYSNTIPITTRGSLGLNTK